MVEENSKVLFLILDTSQVWQIYRDGTNGKTKSSIIIDVDDGGIFSDEETIQRVITELGKTFKVKYLGKLENFIGCKLIENKERDIPYQYINQSYSNIWNIPLGS
jgi:hypothetical protein